jgi:hypothetical protein
MSDQVSLEPEHSVAKASKLAIAAHVGGTSPFVIGVPVDLDHQLLARSQEIHDELATDDDLPSELHPHAPTAKGALPKKLFAVGGPEPIGMSPFSEERRACGAVGTNCLHTDLRVWRSGQTQPPSRTNHDAPEHRHSMALVPRLVAQRAEHWARRDSCAVPRSLAAAPDPSVAQDAVPTAPHARRERVGARDRSRASMRSRSYRSGATLVLRENLVAPAVLREILISRERALVFRVRTDFSHDLGKAGFGRTHTFSSSRS